MAKPAVSLKNRTEYYSNLRKSYHFNGSQETHIFLNGEEGQGTGDQFEILLGAKGLLEQDLSQLEDHLSKLKKRLDSYRFGLPTLTLQAERKQYEVESGDIDALVIKLKNHLKVFKSAQSIPIDTTPQLAHQFKEHLGMHLANKLAFQFERYQMLRKMFHAILYDRQMRFKEVVKQESKAERDVEAHIDVKFTGDEGGLDASSIMPLQQQAVLDETDQNMLKERDQEIDQVVQDVSYITDVMNQIQVMTIEQGTLLDRIDVNLDSTRHNLSKAIGNLEKRAERFSVYQKRLILFCLTLMIFITSLAIFFKR